MANGTTPSLWVENEFDQFIFAQALSGEPAATSDERKIKIRIKIRKTIKSKIKIKSKTSYSPRRSA